MGAEVGGGAYAAETLPVLSLSKTANASFIAVLRSFPADATSNSPAAARTASTPTALAPPACFLKSSETSPPEGSGQAIA